MLHGDVIVLNFNEPVTFVLRVAPRDQIDIRLNIIIYIYIY